MPEWKQEIRQRLANLKLAPTREAAIVEELAQHLDDYYAELLASDATEGEAERRTLAELSGSELLARALRHVERQGAPEPVVLGAPRRSHMLNDFWQDLRYGLRLLRRKPGVTAITALTLGLGIGANTAIFSVIDALLLRPLPVRQPEQLVAFSQSREGRLDGDQWGWWPYPWFERFRELTPYFEGMTITSQIERYNVTINGVGNSPEQGRVRVGLVSGNYFATLGVGAALGRALTLDDDRVPGQQPVAVLSHDYWERSFGRAPDVVGRTFRLEQTTYTVVGVTPAGFKGDWVGQPTDMWIPAMMQSQVMPERPGLLTNQTGQAFGRILARLKPGVPLEQARAAAQVVFEQVLSELTKQRGGQNTRRRIELLPAARGDSEQRATFARPLVILLITVGLVLAIACANVASLLLAQASARQQEIATRLALGAGRFRIIRQLLTESLLLAGLGGVLGLLFALWGTQSLLRIVASGLEPIQLGLALDLRMLGVTAAVALTAGVLCGLAPAIKLARISLLSTRATSANAFSARSRRLGLGPALVICQVALSLLLVIGAGLFARTLHNLKAQELGFEREHLLLVWTSYPQVAFGYDGPAKARFYESVQERVGALPGVRGVSLSRRGLLHGSEAAPFALSSVEGYTPRSKEDATAVWDIVTPNFVETTGMQLMLGRNFGPQDVAGSPRVALVNESFARHFFGQENPLGRRFAGQIRRENPSFEIIGVVRDARFGTLRERDLRMVYFPHRQALAYLDGMCLVVRTATDPATVSAAIRQELRNIDPNLPVVSLDAVAEQMDRLLVRERLIAALVGLFGLLAMVLAAVGLYGTLSYAVARRTNEIGLRLALGAQRSHVLKLVIGQGMRLAVIGGVIGLAAAFGLTRLLASLLFGVSATDPLTFVVVTLGLIAVALLACYIPARRAMQVEPMSALRCE